MAQKFSITSDGHLRIGWAHLHKDLLLPGDHCVGGGFWEIDHIGNRLVLSGKSYDYGYPAWGRLSQLIVPESFGGLRIYYKGDVPSDDFDVSGCLTVKPKTFIRP